MLEHCSLTEYRRVSLRVQWTDGRTDAQLRSDGRDRRIKPARIDVRTVPARYPSETLGIPVSLSYSIWTFSDRTFLNILTNKSPDKRVGLPLGILLNC